MEFIVILMCNGICEFLTLKLFLLFLPLDVVSIIADLFNNPILYNNRIAMSVSTFLSFFLRMLA